MSESSDKRNPSKSKQYEGFVKLAPNASPSDLVEAIRDAKRHIAGAYHVPPSELETGEVKSLLDYSFELAMKYPERKPKVLNAEGLTPEQVIEITGIEAKEDLDQQERKPQPQRYSARSILQLISSTMEPCQRPIRLWPRPRRRKSND